MKERVEVLKTYKLYINGKFSRTESGRYFPLVDKDGKQLGNLCRASRKDIRNAVQAADKAQASWAERSAFNRGQILYRIAENLESRKSEFTKILQRERGISSTKAGKEVDSTIDTFVYFAGWTDKFQALFGSVNPVASSHFNFSIHEAVGTVGAILGEEYSLHSMATTISAIIAGGNSLLLLIDEKNSLSALTLAEVIHHSDVAAGVVNIISGYRSELLEHMAGHMQINSILLWLNDDHNWKQLQEISSQNLKRTVNWKDKTAEDMNSPYAILDFQEVKTTWHPIEQIGGSASNY